MEKPQLIFLDREGSNDRRRGQGKGKKSGKRKDGKSQSEGVAKRRGRLYVSFSMTFRGNLEREGGLGGVWGGTSCEGSEEALAFNRGEPLAVL